MKPSDYISILALIISFLSLGVSIYFQYRDRVKLTTSCKYFPPHPDYDRGHLEIKVVNSGRRPTLLTILGGNLKDGGWQGTQLGGKDKSIRLGEHEFYEKKFYCEDIEVVSPDSESEFTELWFEDSIGDRHFVKGSKEGIKKLLGGR